MDWNKFKNGELAVKVTPKTVGSFLQACEERGLKWKSGSLPTEFCPVILNCSYILCNKHKPPFDGMGFCGADNYYDLPVIEWSNHENR